MLRASKYLAKSADAGLDHAKNDLDFYIKKCSKKIIRGKVKHHMHSCYLAAFSGDREAMYAVAPSHKKMWRSHKGNHKKTFEWLEKTAYEGLTKSQLTLSHYYKHGTGTNIDLIKAYAWQTIALHQLKHSKNSQTKPSALNIIGLENRRLLFSLTLEELDKAQEYITEIKSKIAEPSENSTSAK